VAGIVMGAAGAARAVPVVDDLGVTVDLPSPPGRIVSLAPSNTEILWALGLGGSVVGVTTLCNHPEAAGQAEKVADYISMDAEKIVALKPDLVVAARGNDLEALKGLADLRIPVFALDLNSVAQVLGAIERLGRLTGAGVRAAALQDSLGQRLDRIAAALAEAAQRPRVMWAYWGDPVYTAGAGTIIDDVLTLAGGDNLGRRATGRWPQVGLETIVAWAPEVLITTYMTGEPTAATLAAEIDRLRAMDGWSALPAVRQGRVHYLDADLLTRPGPRLVQALEQVVALLHPGLSVAP
jgi:iron complex transport system substrate-binding protein